MSANDIPTIIPGEEAQDQVILPNRIAFGICMRGIKARLGRSVVTLMGISFGIAFLVSIVSGFHIKSSMHQEAALLRSIGRYSKVLQGEIGTLREKEVVALANAPLGEAQAGFLRALVEEFGVDLKVVGSAESLVPGVGGGSLEAVLSPRATVIALGEYEAQLDGAAQAALQKQRLFVFQKPGQELAQALKQTGVDWKYLGIELREEEKKRAAQRELEQRNKTIFIVIVSLLITVIGITNAMLMSVTERFREIGTMKCLGSLSSFVVKLFLIESSMLGFVGSFFGSLFGVVVALLIYSYQYGLFTILGGVSFSYLFVSGMACILVGVTLSIVAGIYPARVAAKMIPAVALSSHV